MSYIRPWRQTAEIVGFQESAGGRPGVDRCPAGRDDIAPPTRLTPSADDA